MADKKKPRPPVVPPPPNPISELRQGSDTFAGEGPERFLVVILTPPLSVEERVLARFTLQDARAAFRVSASAWIILTDDSVKIWQKKLRPRVREGGHLFIAPIEMGEYQATSPTFRDWLDRYWGRSEDHE